MLQIALLILASFLVFRLVCWIGSHFNNIFGSGKTFKRLLDEGRVDASVYKNATWKEINILGRKKLTSRISKEKRKEIHTAKKKMRYEFLENVEPGFYQYIFIFLIASILGLLLETIFTFVSKGILQSRVGLVWGPFSPLYGFGAVLLTMVLWKLRKQPTWIIFFASAMLGGGLEQLTGWGMEYFMNANSWTYAHLPDAITQWVAWRFLIAWGILGVIWCKTIMPELIYRIGTPSSAFQIVLMGLLSVFFALDIFMTIACFSRANDRLEGVPAHNVFEEYVDAHYDDDFIAVRFENLTITNPHAIDSPSS